MTFTLQYELDFKRLISAVINDSRNTIPETTNQSGIVIFDYIQDQIARVVPGVLIYRIITGNGNLGGYAAIQVQGSLISLLFYQFRPAFQDFTSEILDNISIFIQQNGPLQDIIY